MIKGKTVLITGASRGIGRGIAVKFAENGAFVGINYESNEKAAKETLKLVKKCGGEGVLLKCDVSVAKDVKKMVETLIDERGSIDILVNNAGVYSRSRFEDITSIQWETTLSVNLNGCYNLCREIIPLMKPMSRVIFISSQLALKGSSHGADYASTKAGMLGMMRSLALELASKKILVNAVAPGTIDTDIIASYTKKMREERIDEIPLKRLGDAEDVANVCLFLSSDLASYITGETINVNGGLYIQ